MPVPAFFVPAPAAAILERLESRGFEAWAVGGCVRDSLLGLSPHDWDLCTAATPEEMAAAFEGWPVIPTGLRHGTLTVRLEKENWEVTTYRADGTYTDHRRPDSVRFVTRVEEDLSRRDFTVNAMAWHPRRGLLDPFGGAADLDDRVLRCVGDPRRRFEEDALRILRGVRFAARYGLRVEEATAAAIHEGREQLRRVAPERCMAELRRLLVAPGELLGPVLREFWDVLCVLPGLAYLREMPGYDQQNPHHDRDLMEHTIAVVTATPPREAPRLAALLHDGGKPRCRTVDGQGIAHYYGHAKAGAGLAGAALRRLRCENALRDRVVDLVERHDLWAPPTLPAARRWLGRLGEETLRDLLALQRGDTLGHAPDCQPPRLARLDKWEALVAEVLAKGDCLGLRGLAVNGDDLLAAGFRPGPELGRTLRHLLGEVLEGRLPNDKTALLSEAEKQEGACQDPRNQ